MKKMSSLAKIEKKILLEKHKKLEKVNKRKEKHEIIEIINIKEETELIKRMESEIPEETKALEEIEEKLRKLETKIMKKRFWNKLVKKLYDVINPF